MNETAFLNHRLNLFFVLWIALANFLLLFTAVPGALDQWIGNAILWTLLIPLACLAWINPRRSWGLLLAAVGIVVLLTLGALRKIWISRRTLVSVR